MLEQMYDCAHSHGTLLVFDEVMTGLGRTGIWFAYQQFLPAHLAPDLLIVSKALSGGMFPVSAVLMTEHVYSRMFGTNGRSKSHGSTYSGNHLGMFVALTTVKILEQEGIVEHVRSMEALLRSDLKKIQTDHPTLTEVRGRGLVWALSFATGNGDAAAVASEICISLLEHGVLTSIAAHSPNCIRITPPLTIREQEVALFISALDQSMRDLSE